MSKQTPILMFIRRDIHQLEYDPATQYRFHFALTWFWFLTMVGLPFVPKLWGNTLPALVVQEISLWANFATHFGSMSSALAAKHPSQISTNSSALNTKVEHIPEFDA
jgi:hypothetical protein